MLQKYELIRKEAEEKLAPVKESGKPLIIVGAATCGRATGALDVLQAIKEKLKDISIDANIKQVGCIGMCYAEVLVDIVKPGKPRICYGNMTPEKVGELLHDYLLEDNPRPDLALGIVGEGQLEGIPNLNDSPVFKSQQRVILKNCGHIDPENIDEYIADGYMDWLYVGAQARGYYKEVTSRAAR